jgi:hypothetical protein
VIDLYLIIHEDGKYLTEEADRDDIIRIGVRVSKVSKRHYHG